MLIQWGILYYSLEELVMLGAPLEMRQYKSYGDWSSWKPVDGQRALRKASIRVDEGRCPYEFRVAG